MRPRISTPPRPTPRAPKRPTLGNQADALRAEGANKEEAIDEADVNAANAVNAM